MNTPYTADETKPAAANEAQVLPLPYHAEQGSFNYVIAADGNIVALCDSPAQQAFVVRACNSYETMLAVLKDADQLLGYFHWDSAGGRSDKFELVGKIRDAIAAAGDSK